MADSRDNTPLLELREGDVILTVWENRGSRGTYPSFTLSREYDQAGRKARARSFSGAHVDRIRRLMIRISQDTSREDERT